MSCYRMQQGAIVKDDNMSQCDGTDNCCQKNDLCLGSGLCYSWPNNTNKIDYYVAGCTDSQYQASSCNRACANEIWPAVQYVTDNSLDKWACCGSGSLNQPSCNALTNQTFDGPNPDVFYDAINHIEHLATGVIVGIAVGAFAFVVLVLFLLWRCCCSSRARDKRARGKFVPLSSQGDAVWDSNMHSRGHEFEGPVGSYGNAPYAPHPGPHQYTVANFR